MTKVTKAIIPTAGFDTRSLPVSKNLPKAMFPIVDIPVIHLLVKECIDSGITDIIIVTRYGNDSVEDYFDNNTDLMNHLKAHHKEDRFEKFFEIYEKTNIAFVRQPQNLPYGNGTPLLAAKPFISKDEAFAYFFSDDLILGGPPAIGQLKARFEKLSDTDPNLSAVMGVVQQTPEQALKTGNVFYQDQSTGLVKNIIEKPSQNQEKSPHCLYGRNILSYDIFDYLTPTNTGKDKELWLTDALTHMATKKNVYALKSEGRWYTTGDSINYIKTIIAFALQREDVGAQVLGFLREIMSNPEKITS